MNIRRSKRSRSLLEWMMLDQWTMAPDYRINQRTMQRTVQRFGS